MDEARAKKDEIDSLSDEIAISAATMDATMHVLLSRIRRFDELKGWARQGAKTCAHWLSWRIGDGLGAAREKVRVARALGELPLIDDALRQGTISFAKARAVTRVATPAIEALLLQYSTYSTGAQLERICRGFRQVERICESGRKVAPADERFVRRRRSASGMVRIEAQLTADEADLVFRALDEARRSKNEKTAAKADDATLADGLVLMAETLLSTGPHARAGGERNQILVHISEERVSAEMSGWRAVLADGSWLSGEALLRLACDSGIVMAKVDRDGNVIDVGRKSRTVSPALLRALRIRDGGCRFPGCTHRAFVEAHHIEHWAHGGETKLENTVLLCASHHHAIHDKMFALERNETGELIFHDTLGRPIAPGLASPGATPNVGIHRKTNLPIWDGRPMDFPAAVDGLVRRAGLH